MPDFSLLISYKGVKIMFGAEIKALLAKYFQKNFQLVCTMFDRLFILVFVTNYPLSWQLLMDILFGYPLIG